LGTAKAIENIQDIASKRDYVFNIRTSLNDSNEVRIDKDTHFYRSESIWGDAEFYFYGKVTVAGGKDKASIHMLTENHGLVSIQTPISFLEDYPENMLYKTLGIRATGKRHSATGIIDTASIKFLEIVDYQPKYDEQYLKGLRDKAKKSWLGDINPNTCLNEIRGGYDA
jgi:hypothetical protein